MENLASLLASEIERDATLVAVLVLEIRLVAAGEIRRIPRPLDPDDIGAPVRELAHADRSCPGVRQVEDPEAFEGAGGRLIGHVWYLEHVPIELIEPLHTHVRHPRA